MTSKIPYEIVVMPVDEVKTNPSNPRNISDEKFKKLVQSVRDAPWMLKLRPIVLNKDGVILGGNQRFKACVAAGMTHVWVIRADKIEDSQARRFIIRDNVDFGRWDLEILRREYSQDELYKYGIEIELLQQTAPKGDEDLKPPPAMGDDDAFEPNISDEELEGARKNFNDNTIKQIVFKLPNELYEDTLRSMDNISKELDLDDNSEVLMHLINFYQTSNEMTFEEE